MKRIRYVTNLLHSKGPGENAKAAMMLKDYDDCEGVLNQAACMSLVTTQLQLMTEYEHLYDPVLGPTDRPNRAAETSRLQLERIFKLKEAYRDLKDDILDELGKIDVQVIKPASSARDSLAPVRKTIKKRENKRLAYELAQERAITLEKKVFRAPKEDAALSKAEAERARTAEEFEAVDRHLREILPSLLRITFGLVGPLVETLVAIQHRLMALTYTTLHDYCKAVGFPATALSTQEIIEVWANQFGPVRRKVESIGCLGRNKTMQQNKAKKTGPSVSGVRGLNSMDGTPIDNLSAPVPLPAPRPSQRTEPAFSAPPPPNEKLPFQSTSPSKPGLARANVNSLTTATVLGGSSIAAGKKKPPPPPPPRRTAGQRTGDLSFLQGDRIRVIERTGTDQDWWTGEVNGVTGKFPANYCKPA
ncbi:hypothetical protein VTJ49DRAFT_4150 [Mycothermus thermophilus]|uniref:SH3 domain-containing protein n=1 Tax=Humicola insolens TaxID=85995 RepID=A0ABR3VPE8_HUMIN